MKTNEIKIEINEVKTWEEKTKTKNLTLIWVWEGG